MKKLSYILIIISIILIGTGFYVSIKNRYMYKEKKKNIIESYGTIKLKKYNNQNQIYFYPNFEVKKNDSKKYFTLLLYYKNNVVYQKTFIVWYIDGEKNNRYFVSQGLSDEGLKYTKNYKIRIATNAEIKEFNKKYGIK